MSVTYILKIVQNSNITYCNVLLPAISKLKLDTLAIYSLNI